jgi:hypothetical protein
MLSLASRRHVHIDVIAQRTRGLHGIAKIIFSQLLQRIVGLLVDQIAVLDPSLKSAGGTHAGEALLVLQHFNALSILYNAYTVVNGGHLIAQHGLRRGNIIDLKGAVPPAIACGKKKEHNETKAEQKNAAITT